MAFTSARLLSTSGLHCVSHVLVYFRRYGGKEQKSTTSLNCVQMAHNLIKVAALKVALSHLCGKWKM